MTENHEHSHGHDQGHGHGHGHVTTPAESDADLSSDDVAECPVMPGVQVVKAEAEAAGLFRDYEGRRYWFCCGACEPLWDADPDRYANT